MCIKLTLILARSVPRTRSKEEDFDVLRGEFTRSTNSLIYTMGQYSGEMTGSVVEVSK